MSLAEKLHALLRERFGLREFRGAQALVCETVAAGEDVLLVMPTGAGKSLCYQLPGLARGGTTLVISPLLALMDDQVQKLRAIGMQAEQIHSGRPREELREACARYLRGELDFLLIAPERLGVPGFPEMLARRKPTLIAVDEAHCISQWGHDFRHDYRRLRERLQPLRASAAPSGGGAQLSLLSPAAGAAIPLVALTATATPVVQDDILAELGIPDARRFVLGFRRSNLAIEVHELAPSARAAACRKFLGDAAARPAIVYAPTRKAAEEISAELNRSFPTEFYHAGMPPERREKVQTRFLSGELQVMVATVAFGMGIDKADVRTVIHAGLPGSVEGYYQEIGRAGRDGRMSRAVLFHHFADQRTHEFFFERSYPEPALLRQIHAAYKEDPEAVARKFAKEDPNTVANALDRLKQIGSQDAKAEAEWFAAYRKQRELRRQSASRLQAFIRDSGCRMTFLVRHFGDLVDAADPCGVCDRCTETVSPFEGEQEAASERILGLLVGQPLAVGRLFENSGGLARDVFETQLRALERAGLIRVRSESFEKDGKTIEYRRAELTDQGAARRPVAVTPAAAGSFPKKKRAPRKPRARKKKAPGREARPRRPEWDSV